MVELVDTLGLEPSALRCAGSSPVPGIILFAGVCKYPSTLKNLLKMGPISLQFISVRDLIRGSSVGRAVGC